MNDKIELKDYKFKTIGRSWLFDFSTKYRSGFVSGSNQFEEKNKLTVFIKVNFNSKFLKDCEEKNLLKVIIIFRYNYYSTNTFSNFIYFRVPCQKLKNKNKIKFENILKILLKFILK